jgi:hypothetical protein
MPVGMRESPWGAYLDYVPQSGLKSAKEDRLPFYEFPPLFGSKGVMPVTENQTSTSVSTSTFALPSNRASQLDTNRSLLDRLSNSSLGDNFDSYNRPDFPNSSPLGNNFGSSMRPEFSRRNWSWEVNPNVGRGYRSFEEPTLAPLHKSDVDGITTVILPLRSPAVENLLGKFQLKQDFALKLEQNFLSGITNGNIVFEYSNSRFTAAVAQVHKGEYIIGGDGVDISGLMLGYKKLFSLDGKIFSIVTKPLENPLGSTEFGVSYHTKINGKDYLVGGAPAGWQFVLAHDNGLSAGVGGDTNPDLMGKFVCVEYKFKNGGIGARVETSRRTWGDVSYSIRTWFNL